MKTSKRNIHLWLLCLAIMLLALPAQGAHLADDTLNPGDVLIGPCGVPGAVGPAGVNDDFTNRSINTGIANVAPGGVTTAAGTIVFRNTIQNTGGADDVFIITAPIVPAGFTVEISVNNGASYATVEPPGIAFPLAYRAAGIALVRVTAPAGIKILNGFDVVIRATSTATLTATNETIDRLYTGFIRLDKSSAVVNGSGSATVAPGAEIEFAVTYSNITTAAGVGNSLLTAYNLVINENGNATPNNWGQTTEHITGASDTLGGVIIGDRDGSTSLTDIVTALEPGQTGVFKFKRRVR